MSVGAKFKTVDEFKEYVNQLSDKEIQTWKTQDWLKMYQNLDATLEADINFQKNTADYWKNQTPARNQPTSRMIKYYFVKEVGTDALIKLNRNYRFERDIYFKLIQLARQNGKKMADQNIDLAQFSVTQIMLWNSDIEKIGNTVDKITYDNTQYAHKFDYDTKKSEIKVDDNLEVLGSCRSKDEKSSLISIKMNNMIYRESVLSVLAHESVHAHLQIIRPLYKEEFEQGFVPRNDISRDFYMLIIKNLEYYLRSEYQGAYTGYFKQPCEKMAHLVGDLTERFFRKESRQISERNAQNFYHYLKEIFQSSEKKYPIPVIARYSRDKKFIRLMYKTDDFEVSNEKDFRREYFKYMDKNAADNFLINFKKVKDEDAVEVCVPNNYKDGEAIKEALQKIKDEKILKTNLKHKVINEER